MLRKLNHGEIIFKETILPKDKTALKTTDNFFIVGESETVGNDHRVVIKEDTLLFEKSGVLYIKNDSPIDVYCPNISRHDTVALPSGSWEITVAQEYDYLTMEERNVVD